MSTRHRRVVDYTLLAVIVVLCLAALGVGAFSLWEEAGRATIAREEADARQTQLLARLAELVEDVQALQLAMAGDVEELDRQVDQIRRQRAQRDDSAATAERHQSATSPPTTGPPPPPPRRAQPRDPPPPRPRPPTPAPRPTNRPTPRPTPSPTTQVCVPMTTACITLGGP